MILKAHKIKLNPTFEQEQYFWRAAGIARFVFNWGLAEYNQRLDYNRKNPNNKIKVSGRLLKKEFNKVKPEWVNDVTCWAYQGAFDDLQKAFSNFWKKHKSGLLSKSSKPRKDGYPNGWPRFKSRERSISSFYLANAALKFNGHNVQFDKKRCGWINMCEQLRFDGKVMGARISHRHGFWWLSVQVEVDHELPEQNNGAVGIDLGIKYLAVTSDGQIYDNPKPLENALRKLRRLQRKLDRQRRANNPDNYNPDGTVKKGVKDWYKSNNMLKTEKKIQDLHYRIINVRRETAHELTTEITTNYGLVGIEDLNIRGMMQNKRLAKQIADAALYEKRRQLEYKGQWNNALVVPVDRWFASSKTCNNCGWINADLKLNERQWECRNCHQINHRDGNAALNIRDEALRIVAANYSGGDIKRLNVNSGNGQIVEES